MTEVFLFSTPEKTFNVPFTQNLPLVGMGEDQEVQDADDPFVAVEQLLVDRGPCNSMNLQEMFVRLGSSQERMYLGLDGLAFLVVYLMDLVVHASFEMKGVLIEGDIQEQNQAEMMEGNFHQLREGNCY